MSHSHCRASPGGGGLSSATSVTSAANTASTCDEDRAEQHSPATTLHQHDKGLPGVASGICPCYVRVAPEVEEHHFYCLRSNIRGQCLRLWPDRLQASSTIGGAR
ncbi:unnamed protein product [Pleuronectes platessa]|uniref:Uncharacterized protein n=1 Tax=Pleuronectes platessa TaxID=8262 RepID=A0A9N7VDJ9_PLEPL|nr:unnamed protein product [Pleuronectes platessa]